MSELLLHELSRQAIDSFVSRPSHALLLTAPTGAGKRTIALDLAAKLLGVTDAKLADHPYFKFVTLTDKKSISIESVRDIIHFMSLRTTGNADTSRVVLIENAQLMTTQAQNALLKIIEEPPAGSVIILTAPGERSLLPTIRSRIQHITLQPPETEAVSAYFANQGYSREAINKALLMSDGLPGLTQALLASDTGHPLVAAAAVARDILQKTTFERLLLIDDLSKQRELWTNLLFILGRMADISIQKNAASVIAVQRWKNILAACYDAQAKTTVSAQLKLVMLHFMLTL